MKVKTLGKKVDELLLAHATRICGVLNRANVSKAGLYSDDVAKLSIELTYDEEQKLWVPKLNIDMMLRPVIVYHNEVHHLSDIGIEWEKKESFKSWRNVPQIRYNPLGEISGQDIANLLGTYAEEVECKQKLDENGRPMFEEVLQTKPMWECV